MFFGILKPGIVYEYGKLNRNYVRDLKPKIWKKTETKVMQGNEPVGCPMPKVQEGPFSCKFDNEFLIFIIFHSVGRVTSQTEDFDEFRTFLLPEWGYVFLGVNYSQIVYQ